MVTAAEFGLLTAAVNALPAALRFFERLLESNGSGSSDEQTTEDLLKAKEGLEKLSKAISSLEQIGGYLLESKELHQRLQRVDQDFTTQRYLYSLASATGVFVMTQYQLSEVVKDWKSSARNRYDLEEFLKKTKAIQVPLDVGAKTGEPWALEFSRLAAEIDELIKACSSSSSDGKLVATLAERMDSFGAFLMRQMAKADIDLRDYAETLGERLRKLSGS